MKTGEEKEDKEVKSENTSSDAEDNVKEPTPNPLEKYMRIIQQRRAQELENKVIVLEAGSQKYD